MTFSNKVALPKHSRATGVIAEKILAVESALSEQHYFNPRYSKRRTTCAINNPAAAAIIVLTSLERA